MNRKLLFLPPLIFTLLLQFSSSAQVLFSENFSTATLPSGWSNDSLGLPSMNLWLFTNPYSRVVTGAGFDANFALFDADESLTDDSIPELATLTTPSINITSAGSTLFLEMDEQFRALAPPNGEAKRHIEYSTDNGLIWSTLVFDSLDYGYPNAVHSMYNLTSVLGVDTSILIRFTYTGNYDWWWAIDNVQITSYPNCTSPPNAGTAASTFSSVCPDESFTLSLTGADTAVDLTYQWQSSTDGSTWMDLTGDTLNTVDLIQDSSTYYRCVVLCSSTSTNSIPVLITMNAGTACYCTPLGSSCSGILGSIINVSITGTGLNNTSGCDELTDTAYTIWPSSATTSANLTRGTAYDFVVTTDGTSIVSIWIDYNIDGIYDPSEWTQVCTTSTDSIANTVNILIPNSASVGLTRMRVRSRDSGSQNDSSSACIEFFSGEAEDYFIGLDFNIGMNDLSFTGTSLFPNPGTGMTSIFFEHSILAASITVYDHTGRLVESKDIRNVFSTNLDLSDQANGLYIIRIQSDEGSKTFKYILNR